MKTFVCSSSFFCEIKVNYEYPQPCFTVFFVFQVSISSFSGKVSFSGFFFFLFMLFLSFNSSALASLEHRNS